MNDHSTIAKRYTIKEASELTGLAESTLRYYETIGIISPIERDSSSKYRQYNDIDIHNLDIIACLNATGMSLESMRLYMLNKNAKKTHALDQISLLEELKKKHEQEASFLKLRQQYTIAKIAYWHAIDSGDTKKARNILERTKSLSKALQFPDTK